MRKMRSNSKQSVWLVIDVPAMDSEKVASLESAIREFAQNWIKKTVGSRQIFGDQYHHDVGVADTKELCIIERKRG